MTAQTYSCCRDIWTVTWGGSFNLKEVETQKAEGEQQDAEKNGSFPGAQWTAAL